jgi:AraC family transcriptional regulator
MRRLTTALDPMSAASIFPRPPICSSQPFNWAGIYLEYHQQPAYETPEYCYDWHVVGIHIGAPVTVDISSLGRKIVTDGDVYLFPAHYQQQLRCHQGSEFVDLHLAPHLFEQLHPDLELAQFNLQPHFAVRDPFIQQLCLSLKRELEAPALSGNRFYAESLSQALAAHLLHHYADYAKVMPQPSAWLSVQLLRQVLDYIHQHFQQDLSVETMAALIQLSPYHFSRLFKQSTGLSPYQYILRCRIDRAKQLLQQRQLPIVEIAAQVGFFSQSHFYRHFKRMVGMTPRQFRLYSSLEIAERLES